MKKLLVHILLVTATLAAQAQAPAKFNYQGIARAGSGQPLASQPIAMRISIIDGTPGGTAVYTETQTATTNAYGLYNVTIGSGTVVTGTMTGINWGAGDKYIKVELDPAGGASYTDLGTTQLLSVPFAMYAAGGPGSISGTPNTLVKFTGATTGGNSQFTDNGTSTGVNTPTLSPNVKFQVTAGSIGNGIRSTLIGAASTAVTTPASIYGESSTGIGVVGMSNSQNGVYGSSSGALAGTVGINSGTGYGIWGVATGGGTAGLFEGGTTGRGIVVPSGASGFGINNPVGRLMVVQPVTPVPAVDTFPAIYGYAYTAQGCIKGAISGTYNTSNYGTGIHGIGYQGVSLADCNTAFSTGSQDLGVYGSSNTAGVEGTSTSGIGVVGYNKSGSFAATTGGGNAYGVYGYANNIGSATVPATRYGVYGYATGATTNYAGYFSGNVQITGLISKGGGTFKIDHPLDPEHKYLYHSFVESPDMMNIYNGNITTDAGGYATVEMPGYFNALNKDFRYQLTVIGTFAQAIVAQEMNGNAFKIRTSAPNVKVSWQVTGVRHDKYADAHRVVAEVTKEPEMQGHYLHAAEWGQPESRSADAVTRPKAMPAAVEGKRNEHAPEARQERDGHRKSPAGVEIR